MYPLNDNDLLDLGFVAGSVGESFRLTFAEGDVDYYIQLSPAHNSSDWDCRTYGVQTDDQINWVFIERKLFRNKPSLVEYLDNICPVRANSGKVNTLTVEKDEYFS